MIVAHRMVKFWVRSFSCSEFDFRCFCFIFAVRIVRFSHEFGCIGLVRMRSRLHSLLIWIRDDVVCLSSVYGSVNLRITLEMSLEFLKVVIAW